MLLKKGILKISSIFRTDYNSYGRRRSFMLLRNFPAQCTKTLKKDLPTYSYIRQEKTENLQPPTICNVFLENHLMFKTIIF